MNNQNKKVFQVEKFNSAKFYGSIITYIIIAVTWVIFFDSLLPLIWTNDSLWVSRVNILNDWVFIVFTGLYFYYLVKNVQISSSQISKNSSSEREKILQLFERLPIGLSITELDTGIYLLVNKYFLDVSGYYKDEVIGKSSTELKLWSTEERAQIAGKLDGSNRVVNYEGFFKLKNGNNIKVLMSSEIINYEGKKCILSIMSDITERSLSEVRINESEEKYRTLIESMQDGLFLIVDYRLVFVNSKFAKSLGYEVEEMIGTEFHRYVYNEDLSFVQDIYEKRLSYNGLGTNYELRIVDRNKNVLICEVKAALINYKDGYAVMGTAKDITSERKAEKALQESEVRYKDLMNFLPHTVFEVGLDGTFLFVNKFGINLFEFEEEEFYSEKRKIYQHIDVEEVGRAKDALKAMTLNAVNKAAEYTAITKNGKRFPVLITVAPMHIDGEIKGIRGYLIDITDKKKEEGKLIKAKEKAEESDRLKSNFLAQISHEIRTPLNIILGYNSYLKNELKGTVNGDILPIFDSVYNAGRRLFRTIDLILNMSNLQAGKVEAKLKDVDVAQLVTSILKEMDHFAGSKNITLAFSNQCKNCIIKSDDYILNQVLQNIIDNAIKYTAKGSVEVSLLDIGEKKCIRVKDTGIGISDEFRNELFKPFTQADMGYGRSYEGSGLGLALVKNYADVLGAELSVESKLGHGSVFSVILPE
jgi:PAS domain S-box-containing protein